jgi:hypothetical protein
VVAIKKRKTDDGGAVTTAITTAAVGAGSSVKAKKEQGAGRKQNVPFQRVKLDSVTFAHNGLMDNRYDAKVKTCPQLGT